MNRREKPIAVFDSGAGGVSVLRELVRLMPQENYIYYGDSLNAPYGTKSTEAVRELTVDNISRLIDMGAKEAVIACNTATSAAVSVLRQMYPDIPIIGLEPAVKPAASAAEGGRVLVMATELTLREEKLRKLMERCNDKADVILLPCPELVEFAEAGITDSPELSTYLNRILAPYLDNVNAIVLGCTHFPLLRDAIQSAAKGIRLFDGGEGAAREAKRQLEKRGLLSYKNNGTVNFMSSLAEKAELYKKLFEQ
jgi:glutamate racemase